MNLLTLNNLGSLAALVLAAVLLQRYHGLPRARALPSYAYAGACLLIGSMALNAAGFVPAGIFFTPLCWTGYILWADGAVAALRGRSLLSNNRHAFWLLAVASVPLWTVFEIYNLRLANWIYAGLPANRVIRYVSFAWAFATVWPGIFTTAALLRALGWFTPESTKSTEDVIERSVDRHASPATRFSIAVGAAFLLVPPMLPEAAGVYLFGFVWLGPVLLLDPLNMRAGREALWADLRRGNATRMWALLAAGTVCGLLWEFWNHAAAARWIYTFPILIDYRIFAMPLPGYLGFPAFALDCLAMYAFIEPWILRLTHTAVGSPAVLDL